MVEKKKRRLRLLLTGGFVTVTVLAIAAYLIIDSIRMVTISPAEVRSGADQTLAASDSAEAPDCEQLKCVALTFDSSPGEFTEELLDLLEVEEVPATFFMLGRKHIDTYPELVTRIADDGHEVANHTWTHRSLTDLEPDEIREELVRTQEEIEALTGITPTLMRPPQGRTSDQVSSISEELGLAQILWSVTAKDYQTNDSDLIHERVMDQVDRDGIILLHDIYPGTVPAVPGIIDDLKDEGYTFVTVSQLLAPGVAEPGKIYR